MTTLITCIASTLGISVTFPYSNQLVTIKSNNQTVRYVAPNSIDNYIQVWDAEGRIVTFYPECSEEAKDD